MAIFVFEIGLALFFRDFLGVSLGSTFGLNIVFFAKGRLYHYLHGWLLLMITCIAI